MILVTALMSSVFHFTFCTVWWCYLKTILILSVPQPPSSTRTLVVQTIYFCFVVHALSFIPSGSLWITELSFPHTNTKSYLSHSSSSPSAPDSTGLSPICCFSSCIPFSITTHYATTASLHCRRVLVCGILRWNTPHIFHKIIMSILIQITSPSSLT